jgi:hypothetical protein
MKNIENLIIVQDAGATPLQAEHRAEIVVVLAEYPIAVELLRAGRLWIAADDVKCFLAAIGENGKCGYHCEDADGFRSGIEGEIRDYNADREFYGLPDLRDAVRNEEDRIEAENLPEGYCAD